MTSGVAQDNIVMISIPTRIRVRKSQRLAIRFASMIRIPGEMLIDPAKPLYQRWAS